MVIGIIGIVIGCIWFIASFVIVADSAVQQTVQYLGFVCGSIFIFGSLILLKIDSVNDKKIILWNKIYEKLNNIDENIEIVYKEKIFDDSEEVNNEKLN